MRSLLSKIARPARALIAGGVITALSGCGIIYKNHG